MTVSTRAAVDTSVAVPLLVTSHEHHPRVVAAVGHRSVSLCGHALAETYAVLTRLPGDARVSASDAVLLIEENFAEPLLLSAAGERHAHRELAASGVVGGATYDGLVALAAREHGALLITRDARARSTYDALGVPVETIASPAEP